MRKVLTLIILLLSAGILHAEDTVGREPNISLDYTIYEDLDIEKSGRYYLTLSPGLSITKNAIGDIGININFPQAEYIASLSFGSNFHKYFGTEFTFSHEAVFYRKNDATEFINTFTLAGYLTLRYAFQPKYYFAVIPFVAVGINAGALVAPGSSELLTANDRLNNIFLGKKTVYIPTFGLATKAGVRFRIYSVLIGAGVIYNHSTLDNAMKNMNIAIEVGYTF